MTEQFQDVFDRGKRFGYKRLVTSTKVLPLFLRKRVESIMAPMRSVNRAFVDERRLADETERLIREYGAQGDPLTAANAKIIAKENLLEKGINLYDFNQLLRDYPMFTSVLETMRTWQRNQSNTFIHINKTDETMDVLTRDVAVKNADGQIVLADTEAAQA